MTCVRVSIETASGPTNLARTNLTRFVSVQARAMAELSGIRWSGQAEAPGDFRSLTQAYVRSQLTGRPLPVSNRHSEPSIYQGVAANVAFRFWHDLKHLRLGRAFDLDGEIVVAQAQLAVLRACGWGEGTIEFELLHRDPGADPVQRHGGAVPGQPAVLCPGGGGDHARGGHPARACTGGSADAMKSLLDHALVATITIVVMVLLLRWSWTLLRPLLPVLGAAIVLAAMVMLAYHHWRNRYW